MGPRECAARIVKDIYDGYLWTWQIKNIQWNVLDWLLPKFNIWRANSYFKTNYLVSCKL